MFEAGTTLRRLVGISDDSCGTNPGIVLAGSESEDISTVIEIEPLKIKKGCLIFPAAALHLWKISDLL